MVISQRPKLRDSSAVKHLHVMEQMSYALVRSSHLHRVASSVKVLLVLSGHDECFLAR